MPGGTSGTVQSEKLHARGIVTGSLKTGEEEAVSKGNKVCLVNPRLPLGGKTGYSESIRSRSECQASCGFEKRTSKIEPSILARSSPTYVTRSLHFALKFCHAVSWFHL